MPPRPSGFTLVELLVVIGIIALLIGLLVPVLSSVNRQRNRTNVAATLTSISSILDSYQQDFGDYPRFGLDPTNPTPANPADPLNSATDRGARLLARALFGPAPINDDIRTPAPVAGDLRFRFHDGHGELADPFGFKERRQTVTRGTAPPATVFPGEVREPYLDATRFALRKLPVPLPPSMAELDGYIYGPDVVVLDPVNDQPILYYPARPKSPNINAPGVVNVDGGLFIAKWTNRAVPVQSLYNASDNIGLFLDIDPRTSTDPPHQERFYFRELIGDLNQDGIVNQYDGAGNPVAANGTAEAPIVQKYLLIAVGAEANYYQQPVTNFTPAPLDRFPN